MIELNKTNHAFSLLNDGHQLEVNMSVQPILVYSHSMTMQDKPNYISYIYYISLYSSPICILFVGDVYVDAILLLLPKFR